MLANTSILYTDGVIGCQLPTGFVEESNFYISEVKMKVKVNSDVTSEESHQ